VAQQPAHDIDDAKIYRATITTNRGTIVMDLDPALAPKTVNNFVGLARQGYYDGLTFHRVVPDFVIQGGCPDGSGRGGPGYRFEDEPVVAEYTLIACISLIYVYMLRLIRDVDNPFDYGPDLGGKGSTEVDLFPVVEYVERSRQRLQLPQREVAGVSGVSSRSVSRWPSSSQEPWLRLIRLLFLAIQPRPASSAQALSSSGAVSTQARQRQPGTCCSSQRPRRRSRWWIRRW
jgi:hypothetical protein